MQQDLEHASRSALQQLVQCLCLMLPLLRAFISPSSAQA